METLIILLHIITFAMGALTVFNGVQIYNLGGKIAGPGFAALGVAFMFYSVVAMLL